MALELLQMLMGSNSAVNGSAEPAEESTSADEAGASGPDAKKDTAETKPLRNRRARDLRRHVVENKLSDAQRQCDACLRTRVEIGFDKQERFIHEPATIYILEERNYKYACSCCAEGIETAPASLPAKPIPGSMASSSFLASLIVNKFLDGLPIERIAKQLRRHGADLATSTLNGWMAQAAQMFAVLHERARLELLKSSLISLDDTPLLAMARGQPSGVQRGRQWIYIGDLDRVVYAEYTPDWKGSHPRRVLEGFIGDIQNDGYAGINPLFEQAGGPRRIGCNDHARRKFVQAFEQRDGRAQGVIDIYRALYRVEAEAKEADADAAALLALRQARSVALWKQLGDAISALAPRVGRKEPLGQAITYWQRQQVHLSAFLGDGRLPISNAHVERQIRTVAVFRKNSLFVGSVEAGQRHAALLTMVLNCVLCGANPYEYLVDVIDKIADGWPASRAGELMPPPWLEARKAEQQTDGDAVTRATWAAA